MTELVVAWPGLPDYAARCIRAVIERSAVSVAVIGTRPDVPIEGLPGRFVAAPELAEHGTR